MESCNNKVLLLVPHGAGGRTRFNVRCGSAAFDADGVIAPQGRYCTEHVTEADTDVQCAVCGVGGFKQYQLHDHYLVDCEI
jgi:hypothetical protein